MASSHGRVKDHTKLQKKTFVPSGIPYQTIFIPMLFPSQNDWLRMAGATGAVGARHQRTSVAQSLKNSMENKIQLYVRLSNLQPMAQAYFFFTFYEKNRQRNKDNIQALALKFFFDALQKQGILENDGWKEVVGFDPHFEVSGDHEAGMNVQMYDPYQANARIISDTFMRITKKLDQYKDFRKRTGR